MLVNIILHVVTSCYVFSSAVRCMIVRCRIFSSMQCDDGEDDCCHYDVIACVMHVTHGIWLFYSLYCGKASNLRRFVCGMHRLLLEQPALSIGVMIIWGAKVWQM